MLLPTYFISHGGGPWPWLEGEFRRRHGGLEASLQAIAPGLPARPQAIVMVSGHWEEPQFSVMASARPPMLYDYSGFPEHTYQISYPAPGSPELARRVQQLLQDAGFAAALDGKRGFDHGAFVPLSVMFPDAAIPVVQLSLRSDYDPAAHFEAGRAVSRLRSEAILIVGSGLSYHNLRHFSERGAEASRDFDRWLSDTLAESDPVTRRARLELWTAAPAAREAHPIEDHLLPLMVAAGAAENDTVYRFYHEENFFGGLTVSSFRFGG
jgi:aromatic ring-opening dioxygenase catalytic subunit (LigB family)